MSYSVLAGIGDRETLRQAVFSRSGERVWMVVSSDAGYWLASNEQRHEVYEHISSLSASGAGLAVAYVATRRKEWYVVVDGSEHGPFEWAGGVGMLEDGRAVYTVIKAGAYWVYVGETGFGPFEEASMASLSASGRGYAFAAFSGSKWQVHHDGSMGPPFDEVTNHVAVVDGMHAYCGRSGRLWQVVVGGDIRAEALARVAGSPSVRPDGLWAVWAETKGQWYIESALGRSAEMFEGTVFSEADLAPSIRRVAGVGARNERALVVLDGRVYGPWRGCSRVEHAKEATIASWVTARGQLNRDVLVEGERVFTVVGSGSDLEMLAISRGASLSHDGKEVAVVGQEGDRERVYVNGDAERPFLVISRPPCWSRRCGWVYSAMTLGQEWAVAGGRVYGGFDRVWLMEDASGCLDAPTRLGFGAAVGREVRWYWLESAQH